jgi:hypothetical protein
MTPNEKDLARRLRHVWRHGRVTPESVAATYGESGATSLVKRLTRCGWIDESGFVTDAGRRAMDASPDIPRPPEPEPRDLVAALMADGRPRLVDDVARKLPRLSEEKLKGALNALIRDGVVAVQRQAGDAIYTAVMMQEAAE